jgi:alkanesulfonate monooxygenase SsuD/methylene tetrahydromethanopterin reductase-like flavin-dependent oxidoreductase (luciferase family)
MQAGGSPTGKAFAARNADLVISHGNSVESMKRFNDDIKRLAAEQGRDPSRVKVFFTFKPFIGQTNAEAHDRRNRLFEYGEQRIAPGILAVQGKSGLDISNLPLDEPLSEEGVLKGGGVAGFYYQHYAGDERPTLRQILGREAVKESLPMVGTPDEIAGQIAELQHEVGFDGIAIREALSPIRTAEVVDLLVPALAKRGLIRDSYRHRFLRDNFFDDDA